MFEEAFSFFQYLCYHFENGVNSNIDIGFIFIFFTGTYKQVLSFYYHFL